MREMKDSGIEWIGKIPETWLISQLKRNCKLITGNTPNTKISIWFDGDINWFTPSDFTDSYLLIESKRKLSQKAVDHGVITLFPADINLLVGIGATAGKVGYCTKRAYGNQQVTAICNNCNLLAKYITYYLVIAGHVMFETSMFTTLPILNNSTIGKFPLLMPPLAEQQAIAEFLDAKCADIDSLTADIQKQINILKEYKKSVITQAVTKGLDSNVEMKNTASPYWNKIPKKWCLSDIKYIFKIVKRIAGKEGFDILSVTQKGLKIKDTSRNEGQIAENYKGYQFVYPGDFVMNHMDLLTGWVDLSKLFGVTSPDYRVFKLRDNVQNEAGYYKYVMQCCYSCRIFYSLGQGVSTLGRWRLQTSVFNNFLLPVPPTTEQKAIADFLDAKCADIDAAIAGKQKQLDVLKKYKKSLIYEYVTGKKEVPCHE